MIKHVKVSGEKISLSSFASKSVQCTLIPTLFFKEIQDFIAFGKK